MEQNIVIGLITSTDYIKQIESVFDLELMDAAAAKMLARWSMEYYNKYKEAPGEAIHDIYTRKVNAGKISEDLAEAIEEDILPALNEKYLNSPDKLDYLIEETFKYFTEQKLSRLSEEINDLVEKGEIKEAQTLIENYKKIEKPADDIDMSNESVLKKLREAFTKVSQPVIYYPGALGEFWNEHLVRGGLVGIMAPEKRGKTFLLLDMAIRAVRQGTPTAFFQAGDMTSEQQLIRTSIYLGKKSNKEKYCGPTHIPVKDCIYNQYGDCPNPDLREGDFDIFTASEYDENGDDLIKHKNLFELIEAYEDNPDYKPCYNCLDYKKKPYGVPWIAPKEAVNPLTVHEAEKLFSKYLINSKRKFRLSTHANGSLTLSKIDAILNQWEVMYKFQPRLILIDYGDLLVGPGRDEREKQNNIWKGLRGMSQERDALLVVPTQTDAASYEVDTLSLKNFSEDKRKFAHVTAMFGLNQDKRGIEKKIGLMRINEILLREGDFDINRQVTVLQKLSMGRPILGSYWQFNKYQK